MQQVGGLVLAAGAGEGFPEAIALGRWGGRTLIEHVVSTVANVVPDVVVVVGAAGERVVADTDLGGATIVIDPEWEEGSASPLRVGLDAFSRLRAVDAAVIVDIQYPQVDAGLLTAVLDAYATGGTLAAALKYRYAMGGPVVVGRDLWPRMMGMEGDAAILALFQSHPSWVTEAWVDRLPLRHVRTPDDLVELSRHR